jgi:hypothetical protein
MPPTQLDLEGWKRKTGDVTQQLDATPSRSHVYSRILGAFLRFVRSKLSLRRVSS